MRKQSLLLSLAAASVLAMTFTGCGGEDDTNNDTTGTGGSTATGKTVLSGDITSDMNLTSDTVWVLEGLVAVKDGATLTIQPGTTVAGRNGTGAATSYLVVDKGSKIMAEGTESSPITFTSEDAVDGEEAAVGQWGGLTIIGNAANAQVSAYEVNEDFVPGTTDLTDNSGVLQYVKILNSGITMEQDKEINGLSLVGVGSGTTIDHITVDKSDDDGIEIWGGTVNVSDIEITGCTDDYFDIDDGYAGTVTNLEITTTTGNAGIEMSGTTAATFDGLTINYGSTGAKEGAIYFKKDGIGGHFKNVSIVYDANNSYGAIFSEGTATAANISFENVTISGSSTAERFTNKTDEATDSAAEIKAVFDAGDGNTLVSATATKEVLTGDITADKTLTSDKIWVIDGLVAVKSNATLTINPGTIVAGRNGTGTSTSYLVIDKGSKIEAAGTAASPITFTSEDVIDGEMPAVGQWGGVTLIGNAGNSQVSAYEVNEDFVAGTSDLTDNSGTLQYVRLLNSGITMEQDKEINGFSFVGVGSGTTIDHVTVINSDDDGMEFWGGAVSLSDITIKGCTDDYFDIDDGFSGTVTNLKITTTTGNAGIEMSGTTAATFNNLTITYGSTGHKEGSIYFKKDGIGGHFNGVTINHNASNDYGVIFSEGDADEANIDFTNVTINNNGTDATFVNKTDAATDSADEIETKFNAGTGNTVN